MTFKDLECSRCNLGVELTSLDGTPHARCPGCGIEAIAQIAFDRAVEYSRQGMVDGSLDPISGEGSSAEVVHHTARHRPDLGGLVAPEFVLRGEFH